MSKSCFVLVHFLPVGLREGVPLLLCCVLGDVVTLALEALVWVEWVDLATLHLVEEAVVAA